MDSFLSQFKKLALEGGVDEVYAAYACEILRGDDRLIEEAIEALLSSGAGRDDDGLANKLRALYEEYLSEKRRAEEQTKVEVVADLNAKLSHAMVLNQQQHDRTTTTTNDVEDARPPPEEMEMKRLILERTKQQQLLQEQEELALEAAAEARANEVERAKAKAGKDLIAKIQAKEAKAREEEKAKRKQSKDAQVKDVESRKEKKEERQKRAAKGERRGGGS